MVTASCVTNAVRKMIRGEMTDEEAVRHGLAGNLCRCTGYRAIVDAASELAGRLEASLPGTAAVLSGATLGEVADEDADAAEHDMVRKLKEFDLERRIAIGNAQMKQPGSFADPAEYEVLFKNVSALMRELDEAPG